MSHHDRPSGPTRRFFLRGAAALTAALAALHRGSAKAAPSNVGDGAPASETESNPNPAAAAASRAASKEDLNRRMIMPMSSGCEIRPGQTVRISLRPTFSCQPTRMIIGGSPSEWVIEDVLIDGRSQLHKDGVSGASFSAQELDASGVLKTGGFDACRPPASMDIYVTFVGPDPAGSAFFCGVLGHRIA